MVGEDLEILLEDETSSPYRDGMELVRSLHRLRRESLDIQHQISCIKNRMNADLAIAIRKRHPAFNVAVDKGRCRIGYRSKHFDIIPDLEHGFWDITSNDTRFLRTFKREFHDQTFITDSYQFIADAIVKYFVNHYKTLGEDICGTGAIALNGAQSSLMGIAGWRRKNNKSDKDKTKDKTNVKSES